MAKSDSNYIMEEYFRLKKEKDLLEIENKKMNDSINKNIEIIESYKKDFIKMQQYIEELIDDLNLYKTTFVGIDEILLPESFQSLTNLLNDYNRLYDKIEENGDYYKVLRGEFSRYNIDKDQYIWWDKWDERLTYYKDVLFPNFWHVGKLMDDLKEDIDIDKIYNESDWKNITLHDSTNVYDDTTFSNKNDWEYDLLHNFVNKNFFDEFNEYTNVKCPRCKIGTFMEMESSNPRFKGELFYGCSEYPDCKCILTQLEYRKLIKKHVTKK